MMTASTSFRCPIKAVRYPSFKTCNCCGSVSKDKGDALIRLGTLQKDIGTCQGSFLDPQLIGSRAIRVLLSQGIGSWLKSPNIRFPYELLALAYWDEVVGCRDSIGNQECPKLFAGSAGLPFAPEFDDRASEGTPCTRSSTLQKVFRLKNFGLYAFGG